MPRFALPAASAAAAAALILTLLSCAGEPVPPAAELEKRALEFEGERVALMNGNAYRYDRGARTWEFLQKIYDLDFFEKNYAVEGDRVFRIADDGRRVEVTRHFRSDFEGADSLPDLIGEKAGWTAFTLQSPKTPQVPDYVKLRKAILQGRSGFLDNEVQPVAEPVHGGRRALMARSVASPRNMVCCKASLETELIHFRKGDDFWFSGWFMVKDALPLTLMDLETTWMEEHPGIRIMTSADGLLFELKFPPKPKWRPRKAVPVPVGRWFRVEAHVKLSEGQDGEVAIWQDGVLVVEGKGQTLPVAEAIYNSLEVGISATQVDSTLYVDDVEVSDRRIE